MYRSSAYSFVILVVVAVSPAVAGATGSIKASAATINCGAPHLVSGAHAPTPSLDVSIDGDDKTRTFAHDSSFTIRFNAVTAGSDVINWRIEDYKGTPVTSGVLSIDSGATAADLRCTSNSSGYFAVYAQLQSSGVTVPEAGSRPAGFASFGVLPDYSRMLPTVSPDPLDRHRFGLQGTNFVESGKCCDGNGLQPVNRNLGSTWVLDPRSQSKTEPNHPGQYNPAAYPLDVGFKQGKLARIVTLNGIPPWASTAPGTKSSGSYPPKSFSAFQHYMSLVGKETERVRKEFIPNQQRNYYQVTWEPDPGPATHWAGTDSEFVALYRAAWQGLHSTDPKAVVMGPATEGLSSCGAWVDRLAPLGFTKYIDAVSCHGYYTLGASSAKPPEPADLPGQMQALRKTITALLPPGTKLFITETGVAYPMGTKYSANYPTAEVLARHAEAVVRTHLIFLGEGADVSFLFYSADYTYEVGFGLYFNLDMPHPDFGSPNISPKPAAMAVAAMTRLIDESRSLGALRRMPGGAYGYSFALSDNSHTVTALWAHDASFDANITYEFQLDAPGTSGPAVIVDGMGNPTRAEYTDGKVQLALSEMPVYVLSGNISVLKAQLRAPEGYSTVP
ncbi:MAG TPA: hypothetical protein VHY75_00760 [Steroidobacteraceae bacterium]|jgi:hypothetical protein|nr:hypothetical protein [Steroidobacteraceae bacterium]